MSELVFAASRGDLSRVKALLDRGEAVDAIDGSASQQTALHAASVNGHLEVVSGESAARARAWRRAR